MDAAETLTRRSGQRTGTPAPARVLGATVLHHADARHIGAVAMAGSDARLDLERRAPHFAGDAGRHALDDPYLSRKPLRCRVVDGALRIERGDCPSRVDVHGVALAESCAFPLHSLDSGLVLCLAGRVVLLLHWGDPAGIEPLPSLGLIGHSTALNTVRRDIARVAALDMPVLLRGESGTGKELAAQAIHALSTRSRGEFVAVNTAALPAALAAAELFGAAKGAYTGAERARLGGFRRAHGGTLFLDEIGELASDTQALLLRAIETRSVQALGEDKSTLVDVRLLSATDAALEAAIADGRFRAPLYYRLAGYEIHLPSLRSRREDFGRLLRHFLQIEAAACGAQAQLAPRAADRAPWLPADLVARMARHDWPGNVRELRNAARRLAILGRDLETLPADTHWSAGSDVHPSAAAAPEPPGQGRARLDALSDAQLAGLLAEHGGRIQRVARVLDVPRTSLYDRIARSTELRTAAQRDDAHIAALFQECGGDLAATAARLKMSPATLQRRLRRAPDAP